MKIDAKLLEAFADASKAISELDTCAKMAAATEDMKAVIQQVQDYVSDGSVWFRTFRASSRSVWMSSVDRLVSNVSQCIPENWRTYTVDTRDDEKINTHIIDKLADQQYHRLLRRAQGSKDHFLTKLCHS